ncbi:DsbA family protein [Mycetocola tolaasinivorans]|uniref:DsbA family protein n=1 Tax=Mycetocola tolaasinivorans TaxID=76635 RepID=A0A3L7AAR4_9MICO|nr:DsbA family protein [Mycetocola tolaasinivorans]RLP77469.1 DsbA family protein [Mycetocola tolaasinivorans]
MTQRRTTLIVSGSVLAAAAIGVMIWAGSTGSGDTAPTSPIAESSAPGANTAGEEQPVLDLARRIEGDPLALGPVDAPVTLVEFADYRCPFCGVFSRDSMPQIISEFVDSGQLRVEWRDLPVFGEDSVAAAVAARAAGEQGMFWEYHDAIFEAAPERGHPDYPRERLLEFAAQVKIPDIAKFTADLDRPELTQAVIRDLGEGTSLGVNSTPVFAVNATPIVGAQPLSVFQEVIRQELAKAGR